MISTMAIINSIKGVLNIHFFIFVNESKVCKFSNIFYHLCTAVNRLLLAALHYNHNNCRDQATTKSGKERYSVMFPKYKKGGHIARKIKIGCTYG